MAEAVCECRSRSPPFSRPAEPGWAKAVCIFKQFSNMHLQQRGSRENSLCRLGFTYTKSVSWVGVLFRGRAVNGTNPGCYVHINNCAVMVVVLAQTQATVDLPTRHRPWTHGQNNKGVAPGPLYECPTEHLWRCTSTPHPTWWSLRSSAKKNGRNCPKTRWACNSRLKEIWGCTWTDCEYLSLQVIVSNILRWKTNWILCCCTVHCTIHQPIKCTLCFVFSDWSISDTGFFF